MKSTVKTAFMMSLLTLLFSPVLMAADDWRKTDNNQTKIDNLVNLVPGTNHWMAELGERYRNLYAAAQHGLWDFAIYQSEEIEKTVKIVALARPKRAATAQIFLDDVFPALHEATASTDMKKFDKAFADLHAACMACHIANDHAFIAIPTKPSTAASVVFDGLH